MAEFKKSLKGQFLLDGGMLHGSFFHRSVVLICQHDADGAFGLVLSKDSGKKVGEAVIADLPEALRDHPLFIGGPVQPGTLSYLHTDTFIPSANVLPNLALGLAVDTLMDLGESYSATQKIRLFAGYSGWGGGQLEDELERKAWLLHPASIELVFDADPAALWKTIMCEKGPVYRILSQGPEDLSWN